MNKRSRPGCRVATCLSLLASMAACDPDNGVDPKGGTPGEILETGAEKVWRVQWDNPVVGGVYDLPTGEVEGFAHRKGDSWEYNKFDLELEADDADGVRRLYPWPEYSGVFGDDESWFYYEAHGMKLAPGVVGDPFANISYASAFHQTWNMPELPYEDALGNTTGQFELDPAVGLVPLRVVVLHGQGLSAPGFSGPALSPGWFSNQSAELLFDDVWDGSKKTNNTGPFFPDNVITTWDRRPGKGQVADDPKYGGGRHLQPDRVLDQCGVQFRMVSYHQCEVPPDILYDADCGSELAQTGHFKKVRSYVDEHCNLPQDGIPRVIFLGSLGSDDCVAGKLLGAQLDDDVMIANSFAGKKTLSHELGHLLGLGHVSDSNNLMSQSYDGIGLTQEQCVTANKRAKDYQQEVWPDTGSDAPPPWPAPQPSQEAAQELADTLDDEQVHQLVELVGPEGYESALSIIYGDETEWATRKYIVTSMFQPHFEALEEILDAEQFELLMQVAELEEE